MLKKVDVFSNLFDTIQSCPRIGSRVCLPYASRVMGSRLPRTLGMATHLLGCLLCSGRRIHRVKQKFCIPGKQTLHKD